MVKVDVFSSHTFAASFPYMATSHLAGIALGRTASHVPTFKAHVTGPKSYRPRGTLFKSKQ